MEKITMSPEIFFGIYKSLPKKYEESIMGRKHQWTGTICKIMDRISEEI